MCLKTSSMMLIKMNLKKTYFVVIVPHFLRKFQVPHSVIKNINSEIKMYTINLSRKNMLSLTVCM